jgi:O-antigen ligase
LNSVIETPFGRGWSSAGWVHSDFLQVAANLGLIAGLIFLGGYIYTLLRFGRRLLPYLREPEQGDLGLSLLLAFVAAGGLLATQGVEVLPQLVLPVWFVWTLVEVWLHQTPDLLVASAAPVSVYPGQVSDFDYRAV